MSKAASAILAVLLVAGCGQAAAVPGKSALGGTWTVVSVPGFQITERGEAPVVQFLVDSRIFAVTDCHEFTLPFTWDGEKATVGQGDSKANPECTPREQQIDGAFAGVLLGADRITGGLPNDRLTISGPAGDVILAQPAAQAA